jgi:hypothetical protein
VHRGEGVLRCPSNRLGERSGVGGGPEQSGPRSLPVDSGCVEPVSDQGICAPDVARLANALLALVEALDAAPAWHVGAGVPLDMLGKDGDFYLDKPTGDIFLKESGTWG